MRPITLTMQGFISYRKKTVIDFTKATENLFLITGTTGAGKSSIFDAIVFALYGEASSQLNKRDGTELVSTFGEYVAPYVELTFSERVGETERRYTVKRTPEHFKPNNKNSTQQTVTLTLPDGSVFNGKIRETDEKLQQIVGLTKEQFMQVAMIAQGEFMTVIRAKTTEERKRRSEILRKLFHTETVWRLVDELKTKTDEEKKELDKITAEYKNEAAHIKLPEEGFAEIKALLDRLKTREEPIITDMEALAEGAQELLRFLAEEQCRAEAQKTEAFSQQKTAERELTRAENLMIFFNQYDKARKDLSECEAQSAQIEQYAALSTKISDAYEILPYFHAYLEAKHQQEQREKNIAEKKAELPVLQKESEKAERELIAAREAFERAQNEESAVNERAKQALALFVQREESLKAVQNARREREKREKNAEDAQKAKADFQERLIRQRKRFEELLEVPTRLEKLGRWQNECGRLNEITDKLSALIGQENETEKRSQELKTKIGKAQKEYEAAVNEYTARLNAFLLSQAGILAAELKEGCPCPVCGSREHPSPRTLTEAEKGITQQQLDTLKKEQERCSEELKKLCEQEKANEERGKQLQKQIKEKEQEEKDALGLLENALGLPALAAPSRERKQAIVNCLESERLVLMRENEEYRGLKNEIDLADERALEYQSALDNALLCVREAAATEADANGAYRSLLEQKPFYETKELAERAKKEAEEKLRQTRAAYHDAEERQRGSAASLTKCETSLRDSKQELPEADKKRVEAQKKYEELLRAKNTDQAHFTELTEKYKKEDARDLQSKVTEYGKKRASAEERKKAAAQGIGDSERPDIAALEQTKKTADDLYEAARKKADEIANRLRDNRVVQKRLMEIFGERNRIFDRFNRLSHLYKCFAGQIKGARMGLETYIQRLYLEQILNAANHHLTQMTNGRSEFKMVSEQKAGEGNKDRGLDLLIYSKINCVEREVSTLSGGESFMAALSLALGLADTITAASSAVNLDILFIDEGFGSLDDASRNQAVRVLKQLAGGSRLVGIISHVSELKQQINQKLEITKSETEGSSVCWQD